MRRFEVLSIVGLLTTASVWAVEGWAAPLKASGPACSDRAGAVLEYGAAPLKANGPACSDRVGTVPECGAPSCTESTFRAHQTESTFRAHQTESTFRAHQTESTFRAHQTESTFRVNPQEASRPETSEWEWTRPEPIVLASNENTLYKAGPVLVGPDGGLSQFLMQLLETDDVRLYLTESDGLGATWTEPEMISAGGGFRYDLGTSTIDPMGNRTFVWSQYGDNGVQVLATRQVRQNRSYAGTSAPVYDSERAGGKSANTLDIPVDSGASLEERGWSTEVLAFDDEITTGDLRIASDSAGNVVVAYRVWWDDDTFHWYVTVLDSADERWSTPALLTEANVGELKLFVNRKGASLYAAYWIVTEDDTESWIEVRRFDSAMRSWGPSTSVSSAPPVPHPPGTVVIPSDYSLWGVVDDDGVITLVYSSLVRDGTNCGPLYPCTTYGYFTWAVRVAEGRTLTPSLLLETVDDDADWAFTGNAMDVDRAGNVLVADTWFNRSGSGPGSNTVLSVLEYKAVEDQWTHHVVSVDPKSYAASGSLWDSMFDHTVGVVYVGDEGRAIVVNGRLQNGAFESFAFDGERWSLRPLEISSHVMQEGLWPVDVRDVNGEAVLVYTTGRSDIMCSVLVEYMETLND